MGGLHCGQGVPGRDAGGECLCAQGLLHAWLGTVAMPSHCMAALPSRIAWHMRPFRCFSLIGLAADPTRPSLQCRMLTTSAGLMRPLTHCASSGSARVAWRLPGPRCWAAAVRAASCSSSCRARCWRPA